MNRLGTFVHVSDLHFGGEKVGRSFDPWARYVPLLNGFVGHDPATLRYLQSSLNRLRRSEPGTKLIVTGDLTAFGAAAQFHDSTSFLGGPGKAPHFLGLNEVDWKDRSIPGNHDQWPGIPFFPLGGPNKTVHKLFAAHRVGPHVALPGRRVLEFLRLDSDADVDPWSAQRLYACGSFVSNLATLDSKMTPPETNRIRVLLIHHSFEFIGHVVRPGTLMPISVGIHHLAIDPPSRQALAAFVRKHDIRVLLTGHVHCPHYLGNPFGLFADATPALEARCGSSTQRLAPGGPGGAKGRVQNTLMVHRLLEDPATRHIYWDTEVCGLSLHQGTGFAPHPPSANGPAVQHRQRVWP